MDYSSFLIQQSVRRSQKRKTEGEEEDDTESPGKEEYRQTLLNALARNRSQPRQKGVLSFKSATPSTAGELDYPCPLIKIKLSLHCYYNCVYNLSYWYIYLIIILPIMSMAVLFL